MVTRRKFLGFLAVTPLLALLHKAGARNQLSGTYAQETSSPIMTASEVRYRRGIYNGAAKALAKKIDDDIIAML